MFHRAALSRSASGSTTLADLPPSSRHTRFTVSAAAAPTCRPARGGPSEGDHVHARAAGECVTHVAAGPVDQVEYAWRHAGFVEHLGEEGAAGSGVHAGFGDDRAPGGQGVDRS